MVGMTLYIAAHFTRSSFQLTSFGAWAWASLPGPTPITGMPWRPAMATPLVENVHLSMRGSPYIPRWALAAAWTSGESSATTHVGKKHSWPYSRPVHALAL